LGIGARGVTGKVGDVGLKLELETLLASSSSVMVSIVTVLFLPLSCVLVKFKVGSDRGYVSGIDISMEGEVGVLGEDGVDAVDSVVGMLRLLMYNLSLYIKSQHDV
jgi:hypothetical protein